jgi:predicted component of type VI protein secretion system
VGRSRDNDITIPELPEPLSSGRHAEFVFEDGRCWVVDRDSTNGTRLNGEPVRRAPIQDRDRIALGDHELVVRLGPGRFAWPALLAAASIALVAALGWWAWSASRGPLDSLAAAARRSVYLIVI